MAPDDSARLMALVIPHDWIRIYSHITASDRFEETSRFNLPEGMVEWEFPEWSTDPGYLTWSAASSLAQTIYRGGAPSAEARAARTPQGAGIARDG